MYGSSLYDPVVRFYDDSFAAGSSLDLNWYATKAVQYGTPVLDLACGTGRLAIEMARRGLQVTAIDNSEGMLEVFKRKLANESKQVRSKIAMARASMHDFSVGRSFKTIICCDAFFHNLTPEKERACLKAVHCHLDDEGRFLVNIHNNPNPRFLAWLTSPEAAAFHKRGEYPLPGTANTLVVYEALHHDTDKQTIRTELHFEILRSDGSVAERADSEWTTRYLCRFEMIYLLELCGLVLESQFGGYNDEAVTPEGQLVLIARKGVLMQ